MIAGVKQGVKPSAERSSYGWTANPGSRELGGGKKHVFTAFLAKTDEH